ncbi:MAG TPA: c-type cytochrome [Burkholderiales bacterium]
MDASRANRLAVAGLVAFILAAVAVAYYGRTELDKAQTPAPIDSRDAAQVERGRAVYANHCASCHGARLQGQPDWRIRLPNGRMPAPPHDESGHTWHHPDEVLFGITKHGLVPPYAPKGYESDMPAFGSVLTDSDIRAVLAFIESRWPSEVVKLRNEMLEQTRRQGK